MAIFSFTTQCFRNSGMQTRGLAPGELPRQHYRNECQKTEVRGLELRERKAFRVRLLADALFVFTSLVPEWSSPTSGVAAV